MIGHRSFVVLNGNGGSAVVNQWKRHRFKTNEKTEPENPDSIKLIMQKLHIESKIRILIKKLEI